MANATVASKSVSSQAFSRYNPKPRASSLNTLESILERAIKALKMGELGTPLSLRDVEKLRDTAASYAALAVTVEDSPWENDGWNQQRMKELNKVVRIYKTSPIRNRRLSLKENQRRLSLYAVRIFEEIRNHAWIHIDVAQYRLNLAQKG